MALLDTVDVTKLLMVEGTTPSNPAAGKQKLFVRSSDHLLCLVDSAGTVTPYGGALTNPMTTAGDLILGGASGTPGRLAITVPAANILNVPGVVNGETTWSVKSIHDGTAPSTQAFGDAAAAGTALTAAHRDHKHAMPLASAANGVLQVNRYAPATTVYSTTSATMADVDATNMAVTFTAPASGNVIVTLSAWQDWTTLPCNVIWDLRESTTDLNVGGIIQRGATGEEAYTTLPCYLTGVSAGSHTYKWSFGLVSAGGGATGRIVIGPGATGTGHFGPAIMVVQAAP